jgi:REP element-mobilizing transposase RayT
VVFGTKERRRSIRKEFQSRLWAYVAGICKSDGVFVHAVSGAEDHVHMLIQIPPTVTVAKAVASIKANSSRWAHGLDEKLSWQQGYAAFSVSASNIPTVQRYIETQDIHHKRMTFEDEFLALLKKHGVQYDPKFVLG